MLKKILPRQNFQKITFIGKATFLMVAFIVLGNLIAAQTGITDQLSKIFYWPDPGQVAGEYEVRIAQTD